MNYLPVVVPAIVPAAPQVTLLDSAIRPTAETDPSGAPLKDIPDSVLALLPSEQRMELEAREGDRWTRGFTWAPENRFPAEARSGCDYSSVDLPELNAPTGLVTHPSITGGSLAAATYEYQITALNANGETTPCALVDAVVGGTDLGSVRLTWADQGNVQFNVYGNTSGSIGLLATVGPFPEGNTPTWTDTGVASPGAAPPSENTTGGTGSYTNQPVQVCIPWVLVFPDWCSAFGWEARDYKGRAARGLDRSQHYALESEFWTGALAQAQSWPNNYLTNSATVTDITPMSGTPSISQGQRLLQDALASSGYGGQGMLHMQRQAAPNLLNARRVGPQYLDVYDNIIIPGVGYPGTGPGGNAPDAGTTWMYATDLIAVRIEDEATIFPDTFAEALDRGQAGEPNTIRFRAMKFAAAYGDFAVHFACNVTLDT